jgi:hypothetical protein
MDKELELYKLIAPPIELSNDVRWVDEFGWIEDEFVVWVSKWWWNDFIAKLTQILGYSIFGDGGFKARIQADGICFVLSDITDKYGINLENVFPKEEYKY